MFPCELEQGWTKGCGVGTIKQTTSRGCFHCTLYEWNACSSNFGVSRPVPKHIYQHSKVCVGCWLPFPSGVKFVHDFHHEKIFLGQTTCSRTSMSLKRCCYMVKQVAYKVLNDVQTLFQIKILGQIIKVAWGRRRGPCSWSHTALPGPLNEQYLENISVLCFGRSYHYGKGLQLLNLTSSSIFIVFRIQVYNDCNETLNTLDFSACKGG